MATAPYDTVITAINAANTRLNGKVETLQPIGGQLVGNGNSFSQQVANDAWRKLQNRLADLRYSGLQQEQVFADVPQVSGTDPLLQVSIGYNGYFNGSNTVSTPALPQNLIRPYELTERTFGSGALFTTMDELLYAIPRVPKTNWNRQWLWRADTLYMPGSLVATDMTMVFAAFLADFVDSSVPWFQASMPIMYCLDAMTDYLCREIMVARGRMDAAVAFQASAEDNAKLIVNRDTGGPKSIVKSSEYQKMADQYTPNNGPVTEQVNRK